MKLTDLKALDKPSLRWDGGEAEEMKSHPKPDGLWEARLDDEAPELPSHHGRIAKD